MTDCEKSVEREILRLYQTGERDRAFQQFVNQYQTRLYSIAYRMLGNHDDAMDVLQEIFLHVHQSLQSFKEQSSLYTWVYRLASNVCLNYRKKRNRTQYQVVWDESLQGMLHVERPNEEPDKMCEEKYNRFLVQQAILYLPETQRVLIVLHDLEGIPIIDIATILDITGSAAKARLHRGRAALRKIIGKGLVVKGMEGIGVFSEDSFGKLM